MVLGNEREAAREVAHAARPKCLGMRATIVGTAGADVLRGTAGDDVIAGLGGNDVLKGLGGDDDICGGPGNDRLVGGPGSFDRLSGGPGNDTLLGGAGSDFLLGGSGNDVLNGGDSYDDASFEHSPNAVTADMTAGTATGEGSDTLIGVENLTGSPHDDVLVGDANGTLSLDSTATTSSPPVPKETCLLEDRATTLWMAVPNPTLRASGVQSDP